MPDYDYQSDIRSFSQVIEDIGRKDDPRLYLGELVDAFGERGFGALMLFFGLLNIAIGIIPGTTTILGAPLLLMGLQLATRQDQLWLPRWAMKRWIERKAYREGVAKVLPRVRVVERLSRPRLHMMTSELSEILIGVATVALACILVLPIWGGNLVPALIISTFGFGLMQRDGLVVLVGWLGVTGVVLFIWLAWELVSRALSTFVQATGLG
ncbi:MAG: hypothetical protein A2623_13895 [Caulobacterales bacterium RIFCSPHIGHO2_01_FULL_70_19]|nr:MAG: hypothetical protein A2623_13895 [Caulobacterales bacterium RIFCSPHIGHO2_01_FULL_70_19]